MEGFDRRLIQAPQGGTWLGVCGGAGNAERIHGEGETTDCLNEQEATPRGAMVTLGSLHTMENGVRTAIFLLFWRRAGTVSTRFSPHPNVRRWWEMAGMTTRRPLIRSLTHCHAPSLYHSSPPLPVPSPFWGDEGAVVAHAVKMGSESTWNRARAGNSGNGKRKG